MQRLITGNPQVPVLTQMCMNWMKSMMGQPTQASHVSVGSMGPPTLHLAGDICMLRDESCNSKRTVMTLTKKEADM